LHDEYERIKVISKIEDLLTRNPFLGKTDTQRIIEEDLVQNIQQAQKAVRSLPTSDLANWVCSQDLRSTARVRTIQEAVNFALMIDEPESNSLILDCIQGLICQGFID